MALFRERRDRPGLIGGRGRLRRLDRQDDRGDRREDRREDRGQRPFPPPRTGASQITQNKPKPSVGCRSEGIRRMCWFESRRSSSRQSERTSRSSPRGLQRLNCCFSRPAAQSGSHDAARLGGRRDPVFVKGGVSPFRSNGWSAALPWRRAREDPGEGPSPASSARRKSAPSRSRGPSPAPSASSATSTRSRLSSTSSSSTAWWSGSVLAGGDPLVLGCVQAQHGRPPAGRVRGEATRPAGCRL